MHRQHIRIIYRKVLAVQIRDMVEREKVVPTKIDLELLHTHGLNPFLRKIVIDIHVPELYETAVHKPLGACLVVVLIVQGGQAGKVGYILRLLCPAYPVLQIPSRDIGIVAERTVHAACIQLARNAGDTLEHHIHSETVEFKA